MVKERLPLQPDITALKHVSHAKKYTDKSIHTHTCMFPNVHVPSSLETCR